MRRIIDKCRYYLSETANDYPCFAPCHECPTFSDFEKASLVECEAQQRRTPTLVPTPNGGRLVIHGLNSTRRRHKYRCHGAGWNINLPSFHCLFKTLYHTNLIFFNTHSSNNGNFPKAVRARNRG
ncbi:Protein of unknown function [Pyronema omphalodes CBS 100304]|uniref:Uncharacterized protein n=1 Tax=Pyronema omphalodes (strain CBS 100304) TaxID=1076935 RepID=U4LDR0_PYROM|nr:Protein of unknown function [Pyronema omphalodes CBS 100304]